MTTIPSKRYRNQSTTDPAAALCLALAIGILLIYGTRPGVSQSSFSRTLGNQSLVHGVSLSSEISFAADARYWGANCGHGWASDAACDAISARAQFCAVSVASGYCKEYDAYLQRLK